MKCDYEIRVYVVSIMEKQLNMYIHTTIKNETKKNMVSLYDDIPSGD